jgi:hypothetical protein
MLECLNDFYFLTFGNLNIILSWELKRITTFRDAMYDLTLK